MALIKRLSILVLIMSIPVLSSAKGFGGEADSVFRFGASARDVALGQSVVAAAEGPSAIYWNPSLIAEVSHQEVQLFHAALIEDFSYSYLGYTHPFKSAAGIGVQLLRYGTDGVERRDELNNKAGEFDESQVAIGLGAGTKGLLLPDLGMGLTLNGLQRSLAGRSNSLFGVDLGFNYPFYEKRLITGLTLKNPLTFSSGDTDDKLPFLTNLGLTAYLFPELLIALQVDNNGEFSIGSEYALGHLLSFQLGRGMQGGLSFGMGIQIKDATLRFAMNENTTGLGGTFNTSLNYRFGLDREKVRSRTGSASVPRSIELYRRGEWVRAERMLSHAITLDPTNMEARATHDRLKNILNALGVRQRYHEIRWKESPSWYWVMRSVSSFMDKSYRNAELLGAYAAMNEPNSIALKDLLIYYESVSPIDSMPPKLKDMSPEAFISFKRLKVEEYFNRKEYGRAIQECRDIVLLLPRSAENWERSGSLYYAINEKDKAMQAYEKSLQINPENIKLKKFLDKNFPKQTYGY